MVTTSVLAQNKPDVNSLPECQKSLETTKHNLEKEKKLHKATKDSLQRLKIAFEECADELADLTLQETRQEIQNRQTDKSYQELEEKLKIAIEENGKAQDARRDAETTWRKINETLDSVKKELKDCKDNLKNVEKKQPESVVPISTIQHVFPFFVNDIKVRGTDTKTGYCSDYNNSLRKTKWLSLQISCTSLLDIPKDITMRIKIYMPNGSLWEYSNYDSSKNTYIPTGFSTKEIAPFKIYPSVVNRLTVNEWKKDGKNIFPFGKLKKKGKYRIEIWHNDVCLGVKTFSIY